MIPYEEYLKYMREPLALGKYKYRSFHDDWFYLSGKTDAIDFGFLDEKKEPDDIEQPVIYMLGLGTYFKYTLNLHTNTASDFYFWTFYPSVFNVKSVVTEMERLIKTCRRVEWRVISGCKAEKISDFFCKKHNGTKSVLHDYYKDRQGNYHDKIIYEIMGEGK